MVKLYFVRHAESIANTKGIYQGITYDTDLSALGVRQAMALSDRFDSVEISQIIASPLKRTMQTASKVSENKGMKIIRELGIIETNHGEWEGKYKSEIKERWPHMYKKWLKFPSTTQFPGGEHFLDTQKRIMTWWNDFSNNIIGNTIVVTHDNIIRILVAKVLNMKLNNIWKFHLQPTAVTELEFYPNSLKLVRLGDSDHLGDLAVNLEVHAL